jgi:hypothetical protein
MPMTRNIGDWIDRLIEESDSLAQLEVVPTIGGWAAKIMDDRFLLLDSDGEIFMIGEGSTIELALNKLDRLCADDLNRIMASI